MAFSQGETFNWMLCGQDKFLDMSDSTPEVICPEICLGVYPPIDWDYTQNVGYNYFFSTNFNSATISDKSGNLLFYANGETIYHKNLDTLWSTNAFYPYRISSSQSIFVPKPGNKNRYYYFTPPGIIYSNGVHYSELDITLNNGNGGVVGNADQFLDGPSTNKVTATYHANGKDIWLLMHVMESNVFKAFLITENGISLNPVLSVSGSIHTNNGTTPDYNLIDDASAGQMKFSSSGKYLACVLANNGKVEIFNFNNSTGNLALKTSINQEGVYSVEFSPDGTVLYFSNHFYASQFCATIYQVDLLAGSSAQIQNSITEITQNNSVVFSLYPLQANYSGEIIVFNNDGANTLKLDRIKYPNQLDTLCKFESCFFTIPYLSSNCNYLSGEVEGLTSFFPPFLDRNILFANNCLNDSVLICTQTNTSFDSIRWEFPDPMLGLVSIPNQDSIFHVFPGFGPYEISLKRYRNSGHLDVIKKMLYIYPNVAISLPYDTLVCEGQQISFSAAADSCEVSWVKDYSIDTVHSNSISITQAGKYWPIITNFDDYCGYIDNVDVTIQPNNLELGPDNFNLCANPGQLLDASVNDSSAIFNWNTGDTISSLWVNADGVYSVSVQQGYCIFQDTIALGFDDSLTLALPDSVVLCEGIGIWLSAGDYNADFLWMPGGQTTMEIWADSAGLYSVTASNGCGDFSDSVEFIVPEIPEIDLGSDTAICESNSLLINAYFPHSSFLWNTGSVNSFIEPSQAGIYAVSVSNICGTDSDSTYLSLEYPNIVFLGNDTIVCLQDNFTVQTGFVQGDILWSTGNTNQQIVVPISGIYSVSITNSCGIVEDDISVEVLDIPEISFPVDTHICLGYHIQLSASSPQATYSWSTGNINGSIVTNDPGVYYVTVSNICGTVNDSIEVIVDDSLDIVFGSDTTICLETNFMLQAPQEANQYLWSTGESSQEIAILQTGEYWLQAINACNSSTDTISVIVNENTFAFTFDTLSLDSTQVLQLDAPAGYLSYRWSTSDTVQTIWISNPGEYWLLVTDSLGCTASDTIVILLYISSPEQAISTIRVYPNPTTGELFLEGLNGGESIEVYDFLGKRLLANSANESSQIIRLNKYPKGIYLLIIQNGHQRVTQKVLKI